MKLWGEIKTKLLEHRLRLVLASLLIMPLVLSFVVLYQKDNVEESFAADVLIKAYEVPLKSKIKMGTLSTDSSGVFEWYVVSATDITGDGVNDLRLISYSSPTTDSSSSSKFLYAGLTTDQEMHGQFQNIRARYATNYERRQLNYRFSTNDFYNGITLSYYDTNKYLNYYFKDYEWNVIRATKNKSLLSNDLATYKAYDGGDAVFSGVTSSSYSSISNWGNYNTAYYENTWDKIAWIGTEDAYDFYSTDGSLYNLQTKYNSSYYSSYPFRDSLNGTAYRGFYGSSKSANWTNGVALNSLTSAATRFCCYIDGNADIIQNGSNYRIAPTNYTGELNYARVVTCFPDDSKTLPDLNGFDLAGRIDNFDNAIITERGWYVGINHDNYDDESVVEVTINGENETISNKAIKVEYTGSLNDPEYFEQYVDFSEIIPGYTSGEYVWVRAYVKSKLSPGGEEKTFYGVHLRVQPKTWTVDNYHRDLVITGIKHPSQMIGLPLEDNTPNASNEFSSSVRWGHFDGDTFVAEEGNFETNKDYWVEISLTKTTREPLDINYASESMLSTQRSFIVQGADDYKYYYNPYERTNTSNNLIVYAYYKQKNISSLTPGNTVQMGKFNGHTLNWKVGAMYDLDNDGVDETPLLVLDTYLKEQGSESAYKKAFSFTGQRGEYPIQDRIDNGSNRYADSAIRRWLNFRDGNTTYGNSLHYDDEVLSEGFLSESNFTESEYNAIRGGDIKTLTSWYDGETLFNNGYNTERHIYNENINDLYENYRKSYFEETNDLVFLLGVEDIAYINSTNGNGLNLFSGESYWLRDSKSDTTDEIRTVDSLTSVTSSKASSEKAIRPALLLRGNADLVSLGGGSFKIGDNNKKQQRPATVVTGELNYSKVDTVSYTKSAVASGYIENYDDVQIIEVGFEKVSDTFPNKLFVIEDFTGNQRLWGSKPLEGQDCEESRYLKTKMEYYYNIGWSETAYDYYYRAYVKSFCNGQVVTKYGNVMHAKTGKRTASNKEIKDFEIVGVEPSIREGAKNKPVLTSGEWTAKVVWYEEDGQGGFLDTKFSGSYQDSSKAYKAQITLTNNTGFVWGNVPENSFTVWGADEVISEAVTAKQTTGVVVTAIFYPKFLTVYDLNQLDDVYYRIMLGDKVGHTYSLSSWDDIDGDGEAEALFIYDYDLYLLSSTTSSKALSVNYISPGDERNLGYSPYSEGSRYDLSYLNKWLNHRKTDNNGNVVSDVIRFQTYLRYNSGGPYSALNLYFDDYQINDYEYDAISVAKWKFMLGKHEIEDIKMAEVWDNYQPAHPLDSSTKGPDVRYYLYSNRRAYYSYSYGKFAASGIREVFLTTGNGTQYWSSETSSTDETWLRDGCGTNNNVWSQHFVYNSSPGFYNHSKSFGSNAKATLTPCFYLEPDVILGADPNRNGMFGILDCNEPYKDYAIAITGEPNYSKTPNTADKLLLTGDCDNLTYADIKEKGWYIGYNPDDNMDYSVVDVDTITTTAKKVKYTRDFNRTDGYYEDMVNLIELFPDYTPGDYIWIRAYVKSKCGDLPLKETYGNRIRVKPDFNHNAGSCPLTDLNITGLKNPANYYGKPISDYEVTYDPSYSWNIDEVIWGTYDGTNFTAATGNFRPDVEYTAQIKLVPRHAYPFSIASTISENTFGVSGAKKVYNGSISNGAQVAYVYATFPNIVLQSAPDAPEVTLEKNGTTLTANWEEPDDNGAEITEYIVQLDDEDAVSVSNSTFTKTYLNVANTAHTVKVKAVNEMGESEEGTASVKPCYSIPGDSPISYWEEDIVTYVDGSETVKAEWDISQNGDNSVKAYLFNTKNSSNSYVSGDMTLVFSGSGANILDFAYAYKSGSSFASKGTAENEIFTTSGYDFRTKYNGVGYITPWSWIPNLHVKHVIFADDTAFTNWDMLLCEMDELVDVTFGGESIKSPTSMQGTFRDTSNFQMNFARINTSNVTSMKRIFKGSLKEQIDLSSWSSNSLLNLDEAFANLLGCQSLTFGTSFTGSSLTSASSLFKAGADGSALVKVDLTNAVFGNITDMSFWFSELDSLKSVKFGSSLGTSKVTNMQGMFKGCESLGLEVEGGLAGKTLDLSMFNTKLVTNASSMFEGCESLEKISFGENGTFEKAENISSIFKDMSSLTELNLSKLELDSVTDYSDVFDGCTNLSKIYLPASIKSGISIDLPSEGFLPYSQSGNIVSDITDTAHLIPKNLVGASGVEASYVKIATVNDLKVNEINNASSDEAIYDIIRSEAFKALLPDDENKTVFTGSSNDEKKIAANYLFNHIHSSGTHPYSSLEDAYEDILFSITNAETVTYETLEILPGEKGKFKVPSSLVNTNTITATYTDSGGSHSFAVTPGTDYETIVVDPTVTYTITKTLKNSTLFTDPIEIATITFANHLVLEQGDIIFEGGPFTYNGLAQYVTPKCTKYQGAEFVTTYKLKGTTSLIAKSEVIDAGTYVCETTLTGPDFIDGLKTASFEFTIEKDTFAENDKLTLEGYASSVTYKGAAYNNYALTVKLDGTLLDSSNYEITYGENINAGDGTITVSGKKNFAGFKTFTFTINPKDITSDDDIKPENLNDMEWTGSKLIPPLFDVIDEGIMIGSSPKKLTFESEFNISGYGDNIAIGDDNGSVTVNGTGNYTGTKTFTFNIVGQIIRDLSKIEVLIDDAGLVYTGNALTPTDKVKVKLNGVELPSTDFEITGWENNVNANVHSTAQKAKVKVKLKGNYSSDIVSKEFTISPKELTASDFIYNGQVITKEVSKKTDYNDQIPQSEINKISVILSGFESVKLNFTNAKFKGINPNDNPKIFGNFAIELSGLSITNKNYKLKDDFTSFNIASSNGLLVDKIKPEFSDDWASIPGGCYKAGDEIFITLKFDKSISKSGDDPVLEFWSTNLSDGKIGTLQSGKYNARAEFVSVNNNEVKFKYVVSDGDFILNGFSFKLSGINNYSSLKDLLGNEIEFSQKEKRMDGVKIVTPDAVFEKLINEIQGNDSSSKKKEKILDILLDSDMSDAIFDDPSSGSLKSKIGTGSSNESLKEFVADYLSNITLEGTNKKEELFDEMNKAIELKSAQDEIKTNLDTYPNDKAVIDSQMIKYQKLTPNQKKNFDDTLKEKLDNLYYSNLTDDYKYKDSPQGEVNEIEMYGIVSRTSAGSDPVKLQVDRISDIERINSLQKMIKDNTSSVVDDPSKERIIAPYDIKLVRADDESVLVDIPGEKVLCRIDLPSSYYGKILNIYHKLGDDSLEKVDGKQVQLIDNKTVVYFECESFSPYFMTSDVVSVKASISDDSTSGSVNPNGLITKNYGQSQTFNFARSGETNRVDITLLKFDESSEEFKEVTGLEPINLYKNQSFTLSNITSNMFITFKFTRDDNFKPDDNKKEEEPKGKAITIGPGEFKAYMEGYSDGTFRPQNNLTRAEAATIIARISGSFSDKANYKSYATSFKDIDKNGWYLNYIGFVVSKGYMCGDSKGFRPNDPITRGEFTKLIYKLLENQMKQISISSKFTDVGGKFYQDYSNTLYSASLIKGYGDGTFKGQNAITRSEACSIINSALGRGKNKEATLNAITKSPNYKTFKDLQSFRWYYLDDMIAAVTYWE